MVPEISTFQRIKQKLEDLQRNKKQIPKEIREHIPKNIEYLPERIIDYVMSESEEKNNSGPLHLLKEVLRDWEFSLYKFKSGLWTTFVIATPPYIDIDPEYIESLESAKEKAILPIKPEYLESIEENPPIDQRLFSALLIRYGGEMITEKQLNDILEEKKEFIIKIPKTGNCHYSHVLYRIMTQRYKQRLTELDEEYKKGKSAEVIKEELALLYARLGLS